MTKTRSSKRWSGLISLVYPGRLSGRPTWVRMTLNQGPSSHLLFALLTSTIKDDYRWSAHEGLLGKKIKEDSEVPPSNGGVVNIGLKQGSTLGTADHHQNCFKFKECVNPDIARCGDGYKMVGYDKDDCDVSFHLYDISSHIRYEGTMFPRKLLLTIRNRKNTPSLYVAIEKRLLKPANGVGVEPTAMGSATRVNGPSSNPKGAVDLKASPATRSATAGKRCSAAKMKTLKV